MAISKEMGDLLKIWTISVRIQFFHESDSKQTVEHEKNNRSTVCAKNFVAKIFGVQALKVSFSQGIIFATGSQNKPLKT
jgi:hypothetical protein